MKFNRKQIENLLGADSLGALTPAEARQLEAGLQSADGDLHQLREEYRQVVGMLGLDAPAEQPPASLKAQVMARVKAKTDRPRQTAPGAEAFHLIRTPQVPWREILPGIGFKKLHQEESSDLMTALVRMTPGSRLSAHRHLGEEEVYVIEGQAEMDGVLYQAGDYLYSKENSVHGETHTATGCLLLCRLPAIEFMTQPPAETT